MSTHNGHWVGWAFIAGQWRQLSGPTRGLLAAGRALDDELHRRGLALPNRDTMLTSGEPPRTITPNTEVRPR